MSAESKAFYIFEPFQKFFRKYKIQLGGISPTHELKDIKFIQEYLTNIFDCKLPEELLKIKHLGGKNLNQCSNSNPKVVKTIQLRREHIAAWIKTSNVKVKF